MNKGSIFNKYHLKICCAHLFLLAAIVITRMKLVNFLHVRFSLNSVATLLSSTFNDALFILTGTLLFLALASVKYCGRIAVFTFKLFSIITTFIALIHLKNISMLGGAFNYQWLYYSDFLGTDEIRNSIMVNLSWQISVSFISLSIMILLGSYILNKIATKIISKYKKEQYTYKAWGAFIGGFSIITGLCFFLTDLPSKLTSNPVVAFISSIKEANSNQDELFKLALPANFESFPGPKNEDRILFNAPNDTKIKNVVLYVLESVPAEYIAGYNPKYKVTPNIEKYLDQSAVFTDVYAHSPCTSNSLVSMLGSIYPLISYQTMSYEHPNLNWPTISSELKKNNYRTTFLHASDNRFHKMDEFLSYRNFDKIHDFQSLKCSNKKLKKVEWEHMGGVDEECMVNAFSSWLSSNKNQQPFFGTLWTTQTHYPYFPSDTSIKFDSDSDLNKYLNALHHSDEMLGRLIDTLKANGQFESTLIVVVGDHGEAFGRHQQKGHGVYIYEENVHVPFILINPLLFSGEKYNRVGGHIDIAPTILDILRMDIPEKWQGISMFNPNHPNRAYFFNPWTNHFFGYRDNQYKVIHNATIKKTTIFDIKNDPLETKDLAAKMPEFLDLSQKRLAQWVQLQKKKEDKLEMIKK